MPPIVILGAEGSQVSISFDELAEDNRYLRYRLIHCDSNWNPTQILESDYVTGFNEAEVTSYALSEHTLAHYVHYDLTIPNADMEPLISGNYLVQVFDEDDPNETLLQARFMVSENKAPLSVTVTSRTDNDYNGRHQQLAVNADLEFANVDDPFNDLRLVIVQNGRSAAAHVLDKPLRIGVKSATYEHQPQLIFPGGNEYRRFDISNVRYPGMGVYRYDLVDPYYHATLNADAPRSESRYIYDEDQSGRFFVHELNSTDPDIDADYIMTHFELQMPELKGQDVYIDGDLVNRRLDSDSRMVYDEQLGAYVKSLMLKQGLYNYQYVTIPGGTASIEGDNYETVNEYTILLYHKPPHARYERLIGTAVINSGK